LAHGSFWQPRQPAFWLYLLIVGATGVVALGEQSFLRRISPTGWALSWALLVLYALPVFVLVYLLDLYEREPLSVMLAALVWGAVGATTLAQIANGGWGLVVAKLGGPEFAARWTPALTAPFVEEALKGIGVVLVYLIVRDELDDVMDGFVYGAVCGLGFAVVEDVFYFMGAFGGSPAGSSRASSSGSSRAACTRTCSTRDSSAWGSGTSSPDADPGHRATVCSCPPGSVRSPSSATSCGTHRCSTCSRPSRGPAATASRSCSPPP
jgi:hypothetical protein